MAKIHKAKKHHRRVGRASLNPKSPLVMLGATAVGYLLADTINGQIDKILPAPPAGGTSSLPTIAGGVLAGAGLKRALKKFGVITGYQAVPVIGKRMAGYQAVPVIGRVPSQLSGTPSQLEGFRVNGYTPTGSGSKVMGSVDCNSGSGINNGYPGSGYMS